MCTHHTGAPTTLEQICHCVQYVLYINMIYLVALYVCYYAGTTLHWLNELTESWVRCPIPGLQGGNFIPYDNYMLHMEFLVASDFATFSPLYEGAGCFRHCTKACMWLSEVNFWELVLFLLTHGFW